MDFCPRLAAQPDEPNLVFLYGRERFPAKFAHELMGVYLWRRPHNGNRFRSFFMQLSNVSRESALPFSTTPAATMSRCGVKSPGLSRPTKQRTTSLICLDT